MRGMLMTAVKWGVGSLIAAVVYWALLTDKFDYNGKLLGLVEEKEGFNVDDFVAGMLLFGLGMLGAGAVAKIGVPAPTVKA